MSDVVVRPSYFFSLVLFNEVVYIINAALHATVEGHKNVEKNYVFTQRARNFIVRALFGVLALKKQKQSVHQTVATFFNLNCFNTNIPKKGIK